MLAVVSEQNLRLAMANVFCKQRGEHVFMEESAALSSEVAKAPCKMDMEVNAVPYSLKGNSRDALVRLLNKSGVPSAAQRMALDLLMKLVRREAGRFNMPLFSKVLHAMLERRDSTVLLEHFINKYLTQADFRYHTLLMMHGLARSEQKAALNKLLLEQEQFDCYVSEKLELGGLDDTSSRDWQNRKFDIPCPAAEEEDFGCKANAANSTIEEPEKQVTQEDISSMMVSAARGRQNEPNNANNVKAAGAKKKTNEEDDAEDDDDEEGGGESGGDEGDSDDPGQEDEGGNEEEEEEEEEVDEEDDEEDEQQAQVPNVINNSNTNPNPSAGLDEEEEDEESDDGGVEDEDDGDEDGAAAAGTTGATGAAGAGAGQEDDEDDDEDDGQDDEDDETAPPNKKLKK